jgi:hypothetical protein
MLSTPPIIRAAVLVPTACGRSVVNQPSVCRDMKIARPSCVTARGTQVWLLASPACARAMRVKSTAATIAPLAILSAGGDDPRWCSAGGALIRQELLRWAGKPSLSRLSRRPRARERSGSALSTAA